VFVMSVPLSRQLTNTPDVSKVVSECVLHKKIMSLRNDRFFRCTWNFPRRREEKYWEAPDEDDVRETREEE